VVNSMDIQKPLFWHQGLFLQPQHFQLQDLSLRSQLAPFREWLCPHFWGVRSLEIKKAALGFKSFGALKGSFLFSDGTFVDLSGNAILEDRSFDDSLLENRKNVTVYVGIKKWNPDGENVTVVKKGEPLAGVTTRFIADADPDEIRDLHAGGPVGHVKKLTYFLKLFWESERDHLGEYEFIPLAQIERQGAEIALAPKFLPPCVSLAGSETLSHLVHETTDQLLSRSRELEDHKRRRGIHTSEFGSRDMAYLLALRTINRYIPQLRHFQETPEIHPWHLYGVFRQIVGDLSCFSETINVLGEDAAGSARSLPAYDPYRLWECFSSVQALISQLLDEITAGPDYVIKLENADHAFSSELKPAIFEGSPRFFLALTTDHDPKVVVDAADAFAKLTSRGQIDLLLAHALPGIPLEYLATPPQALPRRGNVFYFSVDSHHEQWSQVKKDQNIAFSWDGAPEDLQVNLMVVGN
jgi:type VI secretion system protein ImpJ